MSIAIILSVVMVMKYESDRQMIGVVHRELTQVSQQASDRISKWMYERSTDVKLVATLASQRGSREHMQATLERMGQLYPRSVAWVGRADANCRIVNTSKPALKGQVLGGDICTQARDRLYVSDIYVNESLDGNYAANPQSVFFIQMAYPIRNEANQFDGFIVMDIRTEYLDSLLTSVNLMVSDGSPARSFVISKRTGKVVIGGDCAGTPVSEELMEVAQHDGNQIAVAWPDGTGFIGGSSTIQAYDDVLSQDWIVVSRAVQSDALSIVDELTQRIVIWGIGLSLLSLIGALILARTLGYPLHELTDSTRHDHPHEMRKPSQARYREITELSTALESRLTDLQAANDRTHEALADREALLKEVHHRVKNNLQVIISLMRLQGSRIKGNPDGRNVVERLTSRVQVMGWLYSKLYEKAIFDNINAHELIPPLVNVIKDTYAQAARVKFNVQAAPVFLNFDQTLVLGLLLIEVVTNAVQHAYPRGQTGNIVDVILTKISQYGYEMIIRDEGCGFDATKRYAGIGLTMASRMATQIGDPMEVTSTEAGTTVRITFSVKPMSEPEGLPVVNT